VGKIRGVRDPIYHLYLQSNSKSPSIPVLGPESSADEVLHFHFPHSLSSPFEPLSIPSTTFTPNPSFLTSSARHD
jgi:hypothetical protein